MLFCRNPEVRGMAEITVQFKTALNGYNKKVVDAFLKDEIEVRLQKKSLQIADLEKQVAELEARLEKLTGGDLAVEEKVELYDRLMKKMDGDYENLLKPAVAKAKAIEKKAELEYEIRMDQAERSAKELYAKTAEQIGEAVAETVDHGMQRMEERLEEKVYARTVTGRMEAFFRKCGAVAEAVGDRVETTVRKSKEQILAYSKRFGKSKRSGT